MPEKFQKSLKKLRAKHPKFFTFAVIALALSFYLRAEPAFFNLTHFSYDQGLDVALVKRLVVDHRFTLISRYTGLEGVFMGPAYTWLMTIPFILSGGSPHANVLFLSSIGIAGAIATYFIVKKISGNHTTAAIAFFFATFSPAFIGSSKIILSPAPLTFFTIFYVWFIYEIIANSKLKFLAPLAFLSSLFFHFEIGYAIFATPAAFLTILLLKGSRYLLNRHSIYAAIAFVLPFLPQLLFDLRHNFIISKAITSFFTGANESLGSEGVGLIGRFSIRLDTFYQDITSSLSFKPEITILVILALAINLYGWFLVIKHKQKKELMLLKILGLITLFTYLGFVLYGGPVWPWYRAGMPTIFSLASALAIKNILTSKQQHIPKLIPTSIVQLTTLIFLVTITLVSIDPISRVKAVAGDYLGDVSTTRNQQEVLDSIYLDAAGLPFALYVYTPPVYPYIWDYQLYWYAQKNYGYLPSPYDVHPQTGNPEIIYLLIETQVEYPTRIHGWRDNFSHFGEAIDSWEFDFGVKVEKWRFDSQPDSSIPLIRYTNVLK